MNKTEWHDFESASPPAIFDCLAKYYDAGLDKFLARRFAGCIRQEGRVFWANPFSEDGGMELTKYGFRPVLWQVTPEGPADLEDQLNGHAKP